jgi:hypothetical protein
MLVDQTVRSSDFTSIGGDGFRLKANADGTYDDPTIYGAYIRGAKLSGSYASPDSMKIIANGYEYNYGRVYYRDFNIYDGDSIIESNLFYSHSYSSGYIASRICNPSSSLIEISILAIVGGDNLCYLDRQVDGGSWVQLASFSINSVAYTGLHVDTAIPSTYSTIRYRARSNSPSNFVGSVKNLSILLFNI